MKWLSATVFILCLAAVSAAQISVRGVLLKDANTRRPVPVSGARVAVAGVGGKITKAGGVFSFDVPNGWPGGKTILVEVYLKGFVIYTPVDGESKIPSPDEAGI